MYQNIKKLRWFPKVPGLWIKKKYMSLPYLKMAAILFKLVSLWAYITIPIPLLCLKNTDRVCPEVIQYYLWMYLDALCGVKAMTFQFQFYFGKQGVLDHREVGQEETRVVGQEETRVWDNYHVLFFFQKLSFWGRLKQACCHGATASFFSSTGLVFFVTHLPSGISEHHSKSLNSP